MARPRVLVLTGYGINCDRETQYAFQIAGAQADRVHLNDLIDGTGTLSAFQILAFPGGFSFGDDVASGRVLASRLKTNLGESVARFVEDGNLVIGICNGFQVMAKYGLVPRIGGSPPVQTLTVTTNDTNRYEDRWVHCLVVSERCVFTRGVGRMDLPVAHGEGKVVTDAQTLKRLEQEGYVVLRYARPDGTPALGEHPFNPNGSMADIAGICDSTGRVFGLMPHPERFLHFTNHPHWTRRKNVLSRSGLGCPEVGDGRVFFENAVRYFG